MEPPPSFPRISQASVGPGQEPLEGTHLADEMNQRRLREVKGFAQSQAVLSRDGHLGCVVPKPTLDSAIHLYIGDKPAHLAGLMGRGLVHRGFRKPPLLDPMTPRCGGGQTVRMGSGCSSRSWQHPG